MKKLIAALASLALLAGACAMPAAAENDRLEEANSSASANETVSYATGGIPVELRSETYVQ